jgi:hypothetical protein
MKVEEVILGVFLLALLILVPTVIYLLAKEEKEK